MTANKAERSKDDDATWVAVGGGWWVVVGFWFSGWCWALGGGANKNRKRSKKRWSEHRRKWGKWALAARHSRENQKTSVATNWATPSITNCCATFPPRCSHPVSTLFGPGLRPTWLEAQCLFVRIYTYIYIYIFFFDEILIENAGGAAGRQARANRIAESPRKRT